jgi:hypothetical protein
LETVSWPEPRAGLVIRYSYLWRREAEAGRDEGVKDRPCAIVVAVKTEADETIVYALPITHAPPRATEQALELPQATKARLGLDGDRSWIMLTEANIFAWPGPDLRFIEGKGPESIAYGMLPPGLTALVRQRFVDLLRERRAGVVKRTE